MKAKQRLYIIMIVLLIILVGYVTYCSILKIEAENAKLEQIMILIGSIVCVFSFIKIHKYLDKINIKKNNILAFFICLIFFILLCSFGLNFISITDYDLSNIIQEVNIMNSNGGKITSEGYFAKYPHQVPLTVLIYYMNNIFNIFHIDLKSFMTIINSLFISITAFFTFLSVKKIKDYKWGLITLIFFAINPVFYVYASYYYSDVICMPFIAIAIFLYVTKKDENNIKKRLLFDAIIGIFIAVGFRIRAVVGIILIAFIIEKFLTKEKRKIISSAILIIVFCIGVVFCNIIEKTTEPPQNDNLEFPFTHFIMMGLNKNSNGKWNEADYKYTYNSGNEKYNNNINRIQERINDLKLDGIFNLIRTKLRVTWTNGDYDYISKLTNVEKINDKYEYIVGNNKVFFIYWCQICKTTILAMFLMSLIKEFRNRDRLNNGYCFLYIAIFGVFLFYIIWEALMRYSLTFLPWLMLLFPIGIEEIYKVIQIRKVKLYFNYNHHEYDTYRIKKIVSYAIILTSLFLLIINYYKYAVKEKKYEDKCVMQIYSSNEQIITNIGNKKIQQTFKAHNKFNQILIKFKNKNTQNKTEYYFTLRDIYGNIIHKEVFSSLTVQDGKYKTFKFQEIIPKDNNNEYIVEIYKENNFETDSIGIENFSKVGYDVYPEGKLIIDGQEVIGDITFKVQNEITRSYTSKTFYILLSITIIITEMFALYPYISLPKNKNKEIYEMEE